MAYNENPLRKDTIVKIINSAKKFVKDHKPETIATAVTVGAVVVAGAYFVAHRNYLNFTDELVEVLSGGDAVSIKKRGTEYVVAQKFYLPEGS